MDLFPTLSQLCQESQLQDSQLALAMQRIQGTLPILGARPDGSSPTLDPRVLAGVLQNIQDNPMLAAWALKVAGTVAEPVWRHFAQDFLFGMVARRKAVVAEQRDQLGRPPPITLVINPTMRCDLRCKGCYAYRFERSADMERDLLTRLLREARAMGIQLITFTGGEPFLYPGIEEVFSDFPDITFLVYTNGQSLDRARAARLADLGNVWPALSVEGYQEETDRRRGRGVYHGLTRAMEFLKAQGVLFGISAMPTRKNAELLCSDAFLDHYRDRGALFGWMFTYMPVGRDPDPELMTTPLQRDALRRQNLHWRRSRPFFMVDFWNDGPLCGGCLSANRFAFITTDGWAQPCTFVHFATHNVKEHSLHQIFESPFFRCIRERQPYHPNLLRPCKIIDHPQVLRELVKKCDARPTYPGAEAVVADPVLRALLDTYSASYAVLAERAWRSEDYQEGRSVAVPFYGRMDLNVLYAERLANARRQLQLSEPPPAGTTSPRA